MPRLLINVECNKRTCGKCKYREPHPDWERFPITAECRMFNAKLKVKSEKPTFYRLKECLQAEKDYFELLLEGWPV